MSWYVQVLTEYAAYGDSVLGKWFVRENGQQNPNVRTVFKPLLNMFHGERGSKRWKQVVDAKFKTASSVLGLVKVHTNTLPLPCPYTHKMCPRNCWTLPCLEASDLFDRSQDLSAETNCHSLEPTSRSLCLVQCKQHVVLLMLAGSVKWAACTQHRLP